MVDRVRKERGDHYHDQDKERRPAQGPSPAPIGPVVVRRAGRHMFHDARTVRGVAGSRREPYIPCYIRSPIQTLPRKVHVCPTTIHLLSASATWPARRGRACRTWT